MIFTYIYIYTVYACPQVWVVMELMPFGALNEILDKGWRTWVIYIYIYRERERERDRDRDRERGRKRERQRQRQRQRDRDRETG